MILEFPTMVKHVQVSQEEHTVTGDTSQHSTAVENKGYSGPRIVSDAWRSRWFANVRNQAHSLHRLRSSCGSSITIEIRSANTLQLAQSTDAGRYTSPRVSTT
jgi:hypothetical protein